MYIPVNPLPGVETNGLTNSILPLSLSFSTLSLSFSLSLSHSPFSLSLAIYTTPPHTMYVATGF